MLWIEYFQCSCREFNTKQWAISRQMRLSYFCCVKGKFYKYQGTGNDFVVLDGREWSHDWNEQQVQKICSRKWGIGSDGLIVVKPHASLDFEMVFFNPDGSQSFCGNGSRVAVSFFNRFFKDQGNFNFMAIDGEHSAKMEGHEVEVKMKNVQGGFTWESGCFLNTGSPHVIVPHSELESLDIFLEGRRVRYHADFANHNGTNVNFVRFGERGLEVRTYERGVEDETLSCGTGVTAAGLYYLEQKKMSGSVSIQTRGGQLEVRADRKGSFEFENVYLKGGAEFVFEGVWEV